MKLVKLLERLEYTCLQGSLDKDVTDIVNDSRKVSEGSLFFCIKGAVSDGHQYVPDVVKKGAKVLVVQDEVEAPEDVTVIRVKDSRYAMAYIAAAWYEYPAEKLKVIGITGTKGKTTTTYMIKSILEAAGHKVGLIGTIEAIIGDKVIPARNTTPESTTVQAYFAQMLEAGWDCVVMEVSSQGLMLFKPCRHGILNVDDPHVEEILAGHTCDVVTYGFGEKADYRASETQLVSRPGYLGIDYHVTGKCNFRVEIDIPGKFSVYNSLAAIAVCDYFGVSEEKMIPALNQAKVKGRIEMMKVSDDFTLMIDYAHNARSRRFEMGEVSGRLADFTIITSDNPRYEDPEAIMEDIVTGISKTDGTYIKISDRKEAIAYAIRHGQPGDVIVLAGKGHEDYQEICGVKYPMDERVLIREILEEEKAQI